MNADFLLVGGRDFQTAVIGSEGKATSPAVHQDGEFHRIRPTMIEQFVERGFDGAPRVEDVIHENNGRAIHVMGNDRRRKFLGNRLAADIVAMKGDVDGTRATDEAFGAEPLGQAVGDNYAAIGNAEEEQAGGLVVPADNSGNDGAQGLFDRFCVVFRGGCHEPKVLRGRVGRVQRKGENGSRQREETLPANGGGDGK